MDPTQILDGVNRTSETVGQMEAQQLLAMIAVCSMVMNVAIVYLTMRLIIPIRLEVTKMCNLLKVAVNKKLESETEHDDSRN